jgi:hypothetical protein
MQPHTGLPANISDLNTISTLTGPPVLVEIIRMDDVSTSAFELDQIRQAREERIRAGVGGEEGEEDGDIDVDGEGPMPQYPRGTLRFQLSDGHTVLEALEYRRINELKLTTPSGFKVCHIQHFRGTDLNRLSSDAIEKCPHCTRHGLSRTNYRHSKGRPNRGTCEKPRIQLCQWLEASHGASIFLKTIMTKYNRTVGYL